MVVQRQDDSDSSTPPRSQSSAGRDGRFSESQDSYDTSASNATSLSLPALVQSQSISRATSCTPSPKLLPPQPLLSIKSQHQARATPTQSSLPSTPPKSERRAAWARDALSPSTASPSPRGVKRSANGVAKSYTTPILAAESQHEPVSCRQQHVREQAKKLQVRLQLAMTKVRHGWENLSMAEIEEMHSAQASPTSAAHAYAPARMIASPHRHSRTLSSLTAASGSRPTTSSSRHDLHQYHNRPPHHQHSRSLSVLASPAAVPFDLSRHLYSPGHSRARSQAQHDWHGLAPSPELAAWPDGGRQGSSGGGGGGGGGNAGHQRRRLATPTPRERDAVDSLMLMGSPAAGGGGSHFVRR